LQPAPAGGLLAFLAQIADPRGRQGRRHSLEAMLASVVCAVLQGARAYAAIAERLHDQEVELRGHWSIENRSHYVRDVTLGEDACSIACGHAPQNLAVLRNTLIAWLRLQGCSNIASGLRASARNTRRLFTKLGILKE
jgi:hypothetical protein